jgi:hypothetical protein
VVRNSTALSGEQFYEDLRKFSGPSVPRIGEFGYKIYSNRAGELVEKTFPSVHFIAECSVGKLRYFSKKPTAICNRTIRLSDEIAVYCTFSRELLGTAEFLDDAILRMLREFVVQP